MSLSDSSCFNKVSWLQKGNSVFAGESSKFLLPVWAQHASCWEVEFCSGLSRMSAWTEVLLLCLCGESLNTAVVSESVWPLFLTSSVNRHLREEAEGLWCGLRWKPLVPPPVKRRCSLRPHAHSELACLQLQSAVQCEVGGLRRISGFRFSPNLVECRSLLAPVAGPPCSGELY